MQKPECIERFKDMYEASIAHTFLFHGATYDYVEEFNTLKPYLSSLLTAAGKEVVYYNRSEGITFCTEKGRQLFMSAVAPSAVAFPGMSGTQSPLPKEPVAALELLEAALKKNPKEAAPDDAVFRGFSVVIEYADTIFPPGDSLGGEDRTALVTILRWAKDPVIAGLGNMVIMVASAKNRVSAPILEASSRIEPIAVSLPSRQDREKFLKAAKGKYSYKLEKGFSDGEFANLTAGLGRIHVVDIIMRAKKDGAPIDKDLIKRRKDEIVLSEYGNVLQIRTPEWGYEAIGGMEYLKDFMRKSVIKPLMDGNSKRTPLGILMCGRLAQGRLLWQKRLQKRPL
ncbi:MAG: hypothetical protein HZB80_01915 [Deltaproteobacteria bacterium]|nr:hypothetical protein [Deltaproteobacteria bacterium]